MIKFIVQRFGENEVPLTFHLPKKGTFENLYKEIDGLGIWRKKDLLYPNGHFDTMISEDTEIQDTLPEEFFMIYT